MALDLGDVPLTAVAYRTTNRLTNIGKEDWSKPSGLLSIWMLGMYKHGPETTVVIPFNKGGQSKLGPVVNDDYFGKVPTERLRTGDGVLFFAADGQFRSKIGLNPQRSTPLCGSYDAAREVLTVVQYNQPSAEVTDYVNSKWELQKQPYAGDVINAYNDGPAEPGAEPLGPFYELETSSPALPLASGASGTHIQTTFHFEGDLKQLDAIARKSLGVSLAEIEAGLEGRQVVGATGGQLRSKKPLTAKEAIERFCKSGREDSNLRPPAPKAGALARLRHAPIPVALPQGSNRNAPSTRKQRTVQAKEEE